MSVSYRRRARVRLKICEICEICWTKIIRVNPCRSVVKKNLRDLRDLREIRYLCQSVSICERYCFWFAYRFIFEHKKKSSSATLLSYFPWFSSETVSFLRPLARRDASTLRPFFVAILSRKPCLFTRRLLCGWNVLFILSICYLCYYSRKIIQFRAAKLQTLFRFSKKTPIFFIS